MKSRNILSGMGWGGGWVIASGVPGLEIMCYFLESANVVGMDVVKLCKVKRRLAVKQMFHWTREVCA